MGRLTKFNADRAKKLLEIISIENPPPIELVAQACGICKKTYYNWLHYGEEDLENEETTEFSEFFTKVHEVKLADVIFLLGKINKSSSKDDTWPQRHCWLAERKYPSYLGVNAQVMNQMQFEIDSIKQAQAKSVMHYTTGVMPLNNQDDE